ncbi:MAG: hypothetical protein LBI69_03115 [Puniceicoccales bacterium]|nr:hypothetical protein [Puniceicoccales bacterium]
MKNLKIISALGALIALLTPLSLPALNLTTGTRFESEFVSCGAKHGKENVNLSVNLEENICGGSGYFGLTSRFMARSDATNKMAPYIGYAHSIDDSYEIDFGYQSYFYTNLGENSEGAKNHTDEIFFGILTNPLIPLETYIVYNFTEDDVCIFASIGTDCDLDRFGLSDCSFSGKLTLGYDRCGRPGGIRNFFVEELAGKRKDREFYAVDLDFIYSRQAHSLLRTGVRIAGNACSKKSYVNASGNHQNLLWFTSAVEFSF